MSRHRFFKHLPTAQSIRESRLLRPFAHHLHHHSLWQFNRRSVAAGVAIGLFFGILVPFAQIFLASVAAILLRVNLPSAAFCTLITNPLTFPPIYFLAYKIGNVLTGSIREVSQTALNADLKQVVKIQQGDVVGWFPSLIDWVQSVAWPLMVGLGVLATVAAVVGYFVVNAIWSFRTRQRWRRRHSGHSGVAGE